MLRKIYSRHVVSNQLFLYTIDLIRYSFFIHRFASISFIAKFKRKKFNVTSRNFQFNKIKLFRNKGLNANEYKFGSGRTIRFESLLCRLLLLRGRI